MVIASEVNMAKHRSPNCPQISFAEAIEKGRKVYDKEHTHPAAKTVVAGDLGYSGLNGRSLTQIGALRQYSILEGGGDALRVTKDAVAYFEMDDGPERSAAIRRMALAPDLFRELQEQYPNELPSDGNLRHTLVSKGFSSKAADDVITVYKANVQLVSGEEGDYDGQERKGAEEPSMIPSVGATPITSKPPITGVQSYAYPLGSDVRAELNLRGVVTIEHLDRLRAHIDLTIESLGGTARKPETGKQ
jgi:hypothetical protein